MKKRFFALICAAVAFCLCLSGCGDNSDKHLKSIQSAGTIKVAVPADYAPYSFKNDITGEYDGIDVQVGRNIAEALGVSFEAVPVETADLISTVKSGDADIAIGRIPDSEKLRYDNLVSTSYDVGHIYAVTKKGNPKNTAGSFENCTVAASEKLNSSVITTLKGIDKISLQFVDKYDIIKSGILDNSIAGYVCYIKDAMELIKNDGLQAQTISNIDIENYVVITKSDSYTLLDAINNAITDMVENGRITEITGTYM